MMMVVVVVGWFSWCMYIPNNKILAIFLFVIAYCIYIIYLHTYILTKLTKPLLLLVNYNENQL